MSCYRVIYFGDEQIFRQPWVVSPTGFNTLAILVSPASVVDIGKKEKMSARIRFSGQTDEVKYFSSEAKLNSEILVELHPGAAYELLGIPQYNFTNRWVEIDDFMHNTTTLYQQIDDCYPDIEKMIPVIDNWLLELAINSTTKPRPEILFAMQQLRQSGGQLDVVQLRNNTGMARSSFQNYFKQQVGVSPKTYSRILRANAVHSQILRMQHSDWQKIIHDFSYFDQSHFIKDFKHFYGCTPSELHKDGFYLSQFLNESESI